MSSGEVQQSSIALAAILYGLCVSLLFSLVASAAIYDFNNRVLIATPDALISNNWLLPGHDRLLTHARVAHEVAEAN